MTHFKQKMADYLHYNQTLKFLKKSMFEAFLLQIDKNTIFKERTVESTIHQFSIQMYQKKPAIIWKSLYLINWALWNSKASRISLLQSYEVP